MSIKSAIKKFVDSEKPIRMIGFWGAGPKDKTNWADLESCDFLSKINNEVKKIYLPGLEFIFIFATMHGLHNGYEEKTIRAYTKEMEVVFNRYGFKYLYLEKLWNKYEISFDEINSIYEKKDHDWWNKVENRDIIEKNAKNRNKKISPKIAAQKYFIMRDIEKTMLEKEFPGYIFHAFSDSRLKNVLPDMPTLYLYARNSWSNAPWFVTEEKAQDN